MTILVLKRMKSQHFQFSVLSFFKFSSFRFVRLLSLSLSRCFRFLVALGSNSCTSGLPFGPLASDMFRYGVHFGPFGFPWLPFGSPWLPSAPFRHHLVPLGSLVAILAQEPSLLRAIRCRLGCDLGTRLKESSGLHPCPRRLAFGLGTQPSDFLRNGLFELW